MMTARGPGSPTRRKFKESCSQCAFVKVKCTKEKPTCSRCHTRGLQCSYELSHRAGRRSAVRVSPDRISRSTRPNSVNPSPPAVPTDSDVFAAQFAIPIQSPEQTPYETPLAPDLSLYEMRNSTGGVMSPYLPGVFPSAHNFAGIDARSTGDFPDNFLLALDDPDAYRLWSSSDKLQGQFDLAALSPSSTSNLCNGALLGDSSCSKKILTVLAGAQNHAHQDLQSQSLTFPTVDEAIASNRYILDVATSVLECTCQKNHRQLRHLLVLAVMDILARYAAVAESGTTETEDQTERAALAFGDLHRVLQFINLLFQQYQHVPSPPMSLSSVPSSSHSTASFQTPSVGDSKSTIDPMMMTTSNEQGTDLTPNPDLKAEDKGCDFAFVLLETEVRQQFESVRDGIKSILRNV